MYTINDIPEKYTEMRNNIKNDLDYDDKIIGIIKNNTIANNTVLTAVVSTDDGAITLYQSFKMLPDKCGIVLFNMTDLAKLQSVIKKATQDCNP